MLIFVLLLIIQPLLALQYVYWSKIDNIDSLYSFHQHLDYESSSVFNIGLVIGRKRTKLTAYISLISIQSTVMCGNN